MLRSIRPTRACDRQSSPGAAADETLNLERPARAEVRCSVLFDGFSMVRRPDGRAMKTALAYSPLYPDDPAPARPNPAYRSFTRSKVISKNFRQSFPF